jgi:hypothetical protein
MTFCVNNGTGKTMGFVDKYYYEQEGFESAQICKPMGEDYLWAFGLSNSVSYFIIGVNYVLRIFIILLIQYIGKPTESEQTQLITDGVFVV